MTSTTVAEGTALHVLTVRPPSAPAKTPSPDSASPPPPGADLSVADLLQAVIYKLDRRGRFPPNDAPIRNAQELEEAENKLSRALALLRGHYNFGTAVDRLLPEVLVLIFECVMRDLDEDLRYTQRLTAFNKLTSVSRAWRNAALERASFWTKIDSAKENTALLFLERSRDAFLDVVLDGDAIEVAEALASSVHRLRRLRIRDMEPGLDDAVRKLLDPPTQSSPSASHLESLVVSGSDSNMFLPNRVFNMDTPRLHTMCLNCCFFFRGSLKTTNLRCLHILNVNVPISNFLGVIEDAPLLEEFLFQGGNIEEQPDSPIKDDKVIALEHVKLFSIDDKAPNSVIQDFLSHISLPESASLYLHVTFVQPRRFRAILPEPRRQHLANLRHITHLRIRDSGCDTIRFSGLSGPHATPFEIQIDLGDSDDVDVVEAGEDTFCFLNALELGAVEELEIDLDLKGAHTFIDDWRKLLRQMPALTALYLGEAGHSHSILTVLSEEDQAGFSGAFLCPRLQTLHMGKDTSWSPLDIYVFVQERQRAGLAVRRICLRIRRHRLDEDSDSEDDTEEVPNFIRKRDLTFLRRIVDTVELMHCVTARGTSCNRIDRVMMELPEIPTPDRTYCL